MVTCTNWYLIRVVRLIKRSPLTLFSPILDHALEKLQVPLLGSYDQSSQ